MLLTDVWMIDSFNVQYPPADLFIAGYFKYSPSISRKPMTLREAAKVNATSLAKLPERKNAAPPLPDRLRTPEMLALLAKMQADYAATSVG
jgi:hypothetical protein